MNPAKKAALEILIAARESLAHDYLGTAGTDEERSRQRNGLRMLLSVYQRVLDG